MSFSFTRIIRNLRRFIILILKDFLLDIIIKKLRLRRSRRNLKIIFI